MTKHSQKDQTDNSSITPKMSRQHIVLPCIESPVLVATSTSGLFTLNPNPHNTKLRTEFIPKGVEDLVRNQLCYLFIIHFSVRSIEILKGIHFVIVSLLPDKPMYFHRPNTSKNPQNKRCKETKKTKTLNIAHPKTPTPTILHRLSLMHTETNKMVKAAHTRYKQNFDISVHNLPLSTHATMYMLIGWQPWKKQQREWQTSRDRNSCQNPLVYFELLPVHRTLSNLMKKVYWTLYQSKERRQTNTQKALLLSNSQYMTQKARTLLTIQRLKRRN